MFRRLGVRGKVLATLVVPALVMIIAAAYITWTSIEGALRAQQTADLVAALELQDDAGTAFAQERGLVIAASGKCLPGKSGPADCTAEAAKQLLLHGSPKMGDDKKPATDDNGDIIYELPSAHDQTNNALDKRDEAFKSLDTSFLDPRVKRAIDQTLYDRSEVYAVQGKVRDDRIAEQEITKAYNIFIEDSVDVMTQLADTTENRDLGERVRAHQLIDELMLTNTYERPLIGNLITQMAISAQQDGEVERATVLRTLGQITLGDIQFEAANAALDKIPGEQHVPPMNGSLGTVRNIILQGNEQQLLNEPATTGRFRDDSAQWVEESRAVRDDIRDDALELAQAQAREAFTAALTTGLIAIGALAFSIITALVIARRLVSPLRRLTQAASVVRDRLPTLVEQVSVPGQGPTMDLDPINIESADEIGQLAAAFNDVNRTTIEVAREQAALRGSIAEMFVNVARRDQVLLNRQLAFLDDLERSEEDPTTLSNLFRLDHLATRMRRNAESLLVLAGIDSGRRVRQPMPVSDVIRTASSEIELYDRVRLNLVTDPTMLGHNALNAAHLLAELLENATMFSEPHTPVEVSTERDQDYVTVSVRDHGLGMTPEEIAEANSKVASHAASDAVGAQRLGLYVVGRLSVRLGAQVEFATGSENVGTHVTVRFPAVLFLPDNSAPLPQPTDPLEARTQAAAARVGNLDGGQGMPAPQATPGAAGLPGAMPANAQASSQFGAPAVPATTSTPRQPEPPLAVPVDLEALTDGTTALGMPRRRQSTNANPQATGMQTTPTGSIVLPELQTPHMPDIPQNDEAISGWSPPQPAAPGNSLPSRAVAKQQQEQREAAAASVPPVFEEASPAPVNVDQRSALFSSFRSLSTVESGDSQSLRLDPVTRDPASLPGGPETDIMRFPTGGTRPPTNGVPQQRPLTASQPQVRPGHVPPSAGFGHEGQAYGEDDEHYEALPAFEELMQDLPSRRSVAAPKPAGKRGLFGRRPGQPATGELRTYQPASAPQAPISSVPQQQPAPYPAETPYPVETPYAADMPYPVDTPQAAAGGAAGFADAQAPAAPPAPPEHTYQRGYEEGYQRALEETRANTVVDVESTTMPRVATRATSPVDQRAAHVAPPERHTAIPERSMRSAPPAPRTALPEPGPATEAVPLPPADATRPPAHVAPPAALPVPRSGAAYEPSSYGEPGPLPGQRAAGSDSQGNDPLDPAYVRDSVEARSEWTASATLYEEMTSLLNRGAYQEDDVKTESSAYMPETHAVPNAAPMGLMRRERGASGTGADPAEEMRQSARIERDPEQLRSRLAAFQSATVRGREEAVDQSGTVHDPEGTNDEGGSTWLPSTMNDVPDSAPQPR